MATWRRLLLMLVPFALFACGPQPVEATPPAIPLTGRVVDRAELLPDTEEVRLTGQLAQLEERTGPQFVVVTVAGLNGRPINAFTLDLARAWGIGSRARNDGVVLLVAPNERKVRIEVGYGLENVLKDEICAKIIRETMLPAFSKGDMQTGITAGVSAIIAILEASPKATPVKVSVSTIAQFRIAA